MNSPISGSYLPEDTRFLLKQIDMPFVNLTEKEKKIQTEKKHYSEMIHLEPVPSAGYLQLFRELTERHRERMAAEAVGLARHIAGQIAGEITLVSLARAGTPVGALLGRILRQRYGREAWHYSLSIIRDRGIDQNALAYICRHHPSTSIVFVDGWTAKGVITFELKAAIADWNAQYLHWPISSDLYVISDIGGTADIAATTDDYAIPSGVLNAPVSGLLSRSILNDAYIGPDDFHGTVYYRHLKPFDHSSWFLDQLMEAAREAQPVAVIKGAELAQQREQMLQYVETLMKRYQIQDINLVKPGIAEATRVLMRRIPELLILQNPDDPDVRHLIQIAEKKSIPIQVNSQSPLKACGLIKTFP